MATIAERHRLTPATSDLVADLALVAGQDYLVQVTGDRPAGLSEGAAAPSDLRLGGHDILPNRTWVITASADPMWAWSRHPKDDTYIAVSEA